MLTRSVCFIPELRLAREEILKCTAKGDRSHRCRTRIVVCTAGNESAVLKTLSSPVVKSQHRTVERVVCKILEVLAQNSFLGAFRMNGGIRQNRPAKLTFFLVSIVYHSGRRVYSYAPLTVQAMSLGLGVEQQDQLH
jgi:hypothetical protein